MICERTRRLRLRLCRCAGCAVFIFRCFVFYLGKRRVDLFLVCLCNGWQKAQRQRLTLLCRWLPELPAKQPRSPLFHRFPGDIERRKLWTDALYLWDPEKSLSPTARILICSDHFLPECYERNMRVLADCGFSTKYAKLKPDAVPSIFARGTASPTADGSAVAPSCSDLDSQEIEWLTRFYVGNICNQILLQHIALA